jgi:crotonobetainyl-CoA:carnitine CoA-transferase CaiB-like acyl-CoA transferase
LDAAVAAWVGERTRDQVVQAFEDADAAVAPVYTAADLLADPQVEALDMLPSVDDPDLGPVRMQNTLFRMSATPGSIRSTGPSAIGADTDRVLAELGVDPAVVADLRRRGVVA